MTTAIATRGQPATGVECAKCGSRAQYRDDDGDMRCVTCGYTRAATMGAVATNSPRGLDRNCPYPDAGQKPNVGHDGVNGRFEWLSGPEIVRLIERTPLLAGEMDCQCLHARHRVHEGERLGRCGRCERLWEACGNEMVLVPWRQRRARIRIHGVAR